MNKVAYYVEEIEKMAEDMTSKNYKAKKLNFLMHDFKEYGNVGTPALREYFEEDVANYVQKHPLFEQYVKDEMFNDFRRKTKHDFANSALAAAITSGAIIGGAIAHKKAPNTLTPALKGGALGAAGGGLVGLVARQLLNEHQRTKEVGPMRSDTWDLIDDVPDDILKKIIKKKMPAQDYANVLSGHMGAKAEQQRAELEKQKMINDMISSRRKQ